MSKDSATLNTAASGSQLDWIALILIAGAVLCTSWSLAAAEWMPHLDLLTTTVAAAFVLSLLVATRRWRGRTAHCVMFLYGVVWVALVVLNQMPDKVYGFTWLDTLRHMVIRLGEHVYLWGDALATGGVSKDNTIFLMFLAALFWLITYVAVWNTIRHRRIWRAVAPAGVVLLINSYYYGGQHALYPYLILYLFFVLAYAARLYTLHQEQRWYSFVYIKVYKCERVYSPVKKCY